MQGATHIYVVKDTLHYNERFHMAQQDFVAFLHRINGTCVCSTKLSQILLFSQFFHLILLPPPVGKYIFVSYFSFNAEN